MKRRCILLLLTSLFLFTGGSAAQPAAPDTRSRFQIPATDEGLPGAGPIRRYDWFKRLWEQRRSAWSQRVQQDQGALVFLGDSITQSWGDNMGDSAFYSLIVSEVHELILKLSEFFVQEDFETNSNITVDCKDLIECKLFAANALQ